VGKISPFELAWSLLKDESMLGEAPWKDVREQALMNVLDEQHTDGGWKGSGKQRPGMATLAAGAPPLTSNDSEPEDLLYDNMTQEEADEFNRQAAQEAQEGQANLLDSYENWKGQPQPQNWSNPPQQGDPFEKRGQLYPFVGVKPKINDTNPFA
jgi:hypothetical protein